VEIKFPAVGINFPQQESQHGCCGKCWPLLWGANRCTVKNNFPKVEKKSPKQEKGISCGKKKAFLPWQPVFGRQESIQATLS
jgi:hypothetical protein